MCDIAVGSDVCDGDTDAAMVVVGRKPEAEVTLFLLSSGVSNEVVILRGNVGRRKDEFDFAMR